MVLKNNVETSHTTTIDVGSTTANCCKRNNYDKQPENQKEVTRNCLTGHYHRAYSAGNNRRNTARQTRKREIKMNTGVYDIRDRTGSKRPDKDSS